MVSTLVIVTSLLIATSKYATSEFVWATYNNEMGLADPVTGVESSGQRFYICLIGLLMCLFSFSGYEGGAHMAEETTRASSSAPRGIIMTCIVNAITGFVYIIGLLYASGCTDTTCIDIVILGGNNDNPTVNIFQQAFTTFDSEGNVSYYRKGGALTMAILILVNLFFAGFSSMTVTTRIGFAMARDGALPGSRWLHHVTRNKVPDRLILLVFCIITLLVLLPLQSLATDPKTGEQSAPVAFYAITSITTIGYQISYCIPILIRATIARNTFKRSSFHLGSFGVPLAYISAIWLLVTSCIFLLPTSFTADDGHLVQTASTFNYTSVVVALVIVLATIYWLVKARRHFKGPARPLREELESAIN